MKKYELTKEALHYNRRVLHRIIALESFGDVQAGAPGGWIESESNLSHEGNCWIYCSAKVCDNAQVYGNAEIHDNAIVCGNAKVYDDAKLFNDAKVVDAAQVFGTARVLDSALIHGKAKIYDNAKVWDNVLIGGDSEVFQLARVEEHANIYGNVKICGLVTVSGTACIKDWVTVCDDAIISGNAILKGAVTISHTKDYIVFKNTFSSYRYFTYTFPNKMWAVGCFYGTSKELIEKAKQDSKEKAAYYSLYVKLVENIEKLNTKYKE